MIFMQYDKSLLIDILSQIIDAIEIVQKRCTYDIQILHGKDKKAI